MRIRVLVLMLVLASTAFGQQPAEASAGVGTAFVQCQAEFGLIPAVTWRNDGSCDGTATIAATGLDNIGLPFVVSGSGAFYSVFEYNEPCLAPGQPAIVLSFARGLFAIHDVPANGTGWSGPVDIFGRFEWHRYGLNPAIVLSDIEVYLGDWLLVASSTGPAGAGTASFIPPGNFDPSTQLLCGQGGGPLSIPVVIAAEVIV